MNFGYLSFQVMVQKKLSAWKILASYIIKFYDLNRSLIVVTVKFHRGFEVGQCCFVNLGSVGKWFDSF